MAAREFPKYFWCDPGVIRVFGDPCHLMGDKNGKAYGKTLKDWIHDNYGSSVYISNDPNPNRANGVRMDMASFEDLVDAYYREGRTKLKIPEGYRQRKVGEWTSLDDYYLGMGSGGNEDIARWFRQGSAFTVGPNHLIICVDESTKKLLNPDQPIPERWRRLKYGEKVNANDLVLRSSQVETNHIYKWVGISRGEVDSIINSSSWPFIREIKYDSSSVNDLSEDEIDEYGVGHCDEDDDYSESAYTREDEEDQDDSDGSEDSLKGLWAPKFPIPKGWYRLPLGEPLVEGDKWLETSYRSCAKNIKNWNLITYTSYGKKVTSESQPCIRKLDASKVEAPKVNLQNVPVEEFIEQAIIPEKEEKMATTAPVASTGFFSTLKASALTNAKCAASTTMAEKITDLVLSRLPRRVQALSGLVPRPVLVFAVSSAVYAAALRFDLPARERVRDISKYALDGSMYEAMRLATRLLEPLFQAIRDMVPSDISQLMDEASK